MTEKGDSSEPEPHENPDWQSRRAALDRRLSESMARNRPAGGGPGASSGMRGMAQGFKIASEFIAGIAVGGAIGYGVDALFGTLPFGLVAFLLLGFAAGVLNVVRATKPGADKGSDGA